jgi:phospholipase C
VAISTPLPPAPATTATSSSGHAIATVFLIVMENHNWSSIAGSPSAPYINSLLSGANDSQTSYATQYYNPPGLHPSLPNYLWLEAGTNFGITDDKYPSSDHPALSSHLVSLLNTAGLSWKAYEEGIDGTTCPLSDTSLGYTVHHDPFVYFDDVTNNLSANSAYCIAHVRPYTQLAADLATNTVARYNFITPNDCDNMHDSCKPTNDRVKQGDIWLATVVPEILNSPAYKNGGALFITWDEAASGDGPIGLIVLSPYARGNGYSNTIHYTHSSTLRTLEEIFGVSPLLGDAANAADLRDLFRTFP